MLSPLLIEGLNAVLYLMARKQRKQSMLELQVALKQEQVQELHC
jgi:hypothetical protein